MISGLAYHIPNQNAKVLLATPANWTPHLLGLAHRNLTHFDNHYKLRLSPLIPNNGSQHSWEVIHDNGSEHTCEVCQQSLTCEHAIQIS